MDYYKIMYDYENDTHAGLIRIEENSLSFDRYAVNEDLKVGVNEVFCDVKQENDENYDYIANNLAWLIVSGRIKNIFESCNLGNYEFVEVKKSDSHEIVGYLMHCMNLVDALDENKSVCTKKKYTIDGIEYEHLSVIKYAVEAIKVGKLDIFKLKKSKIPYFISSSLKEKLTMNKARGFDFLKIKTT